MKKLKSMKIMKYFKKVKNFGKRTGITYLHFLDKPLCETDVLLEAGQGKNVNGNMFALLKSLEREPEWASYTPYWVVTDKTAPSARQKFDDYNFKKVRLLVRNSEEYEKKLATCKYLATDNSFPPYLMKRDDQVYLNTWHGTPLKHLGRSDIKNAVSISNLQKNYFASDYALFPNEHTKDVFMKDYMLDRQYRGNIVLADYPRNGALLDTKACAKVKKAEHLENMRTYAYMPTWRGSGRQADSSTQIEIISEKLNILDKHMKDDQILFVNLHFLVQNALDFENYKHIRKFPSKYETYDFLNACDCLITDYSSVFFDFAVTGRKIILYAYDMEEYMRDKGTYMDMKDFPFPIVEDEVSLLQEMDKKEYASLESFQKTYNAYADPDISNKVLRLLIKGEKQDLNVYQLEHTRPQIVWHVGTLMNQLEHQILFRLLSQVDYKNNDVTLVFEDGFKPAKLRFLENMPEEVYVYSLVKMEPKELMDAFHMFLFRRTGKDLDKLHDFFERDYRKSFYRWKIDELHFMFAKGLKFYYMYQQQGLKVFYHNFPYKIRKFVVITRGWFHRREEYAFKTAAGVIEYDDNFADDILDEFTIYSHETISTLNGLRTENRGENLILHMRLLVKTFKTDQPEQFRVRVGNKIYDPEIRVRVKDKKVYRECKGVYTVTIPYEDCTTQEFQNKVFLVDEYAYGEDQIWEKQTRIVAGKWFRKIKKRMPLKLHQSPNKNLSLFFRYPKETLTLTIRDSNVTDQPIERIKVAFAEKFARFMFWWHPILLFEKNAARYEESGSAVYEELIDEGYTNAYYVLDKNYPFRDQIPEKYRKNIIDKYTLRHYLCFFRTKILIGSESEIHAFELRPINERVLYKIGRTEHTYVFLQHGVMYMVSLDAETRSFFNARKTSKISQKVVVSSEREASHFTELGKFERENLYLCGLPKFDRVKWKPDADKIVIMITWRPWDSIQMFEDMEQTTYYQMLKHILDCIPEEYRDKLYVLPHPLVEDIMKKNNSEFTKYIPQEMKYDTILQETKLLITDYSSISYDAFYRGCNIIFCWQEKEECLEHYGKNAKLMLTEELAFGDVNYDYDKLPGLVRDNYNRSQLPIHKEHYREIVEFHDGKNSKRLVEFLKQDNII